MVKNPLAVWETLELPRGMSKFGGTRDIFSILKAVMVSKVYISVKTHPIVCFVCEKLMEVIPQLSCANYQKIL